MGEHDQKTKDGELEADDRFPSGRWTGFYLQRPLAGRQKMELALTFRAGVVQGEGRDVVNDFIIRGRYDLTTAKVTLHKHYVRQHHVLYFGAADEGRGIWGIWELEKQRGGWHIWPVGMGDPTQEHTAAEVDQPVEAEAIMVEPVLSGRGLE